MLGDCSFRFWKSRQLQAARPRQVCEGQLLIFMQANSDRLGFSMKKIRDQGRIRFDTWYVRHKNKPLVLLYIALHACICSKYCPSDFWYIVYLKILASCLSGILNTRIILILHQLLPKVLFEQQTKMLHSQISRDVQFLSRHMDGRYKSYYPTAKVTWRVRTLNDFFFH